MTGLKPVRPIKLADDELDPGIRGLLEEHRASLGPYGWTIHAEKIGDHMSFQFDNPMSGTSSGMGFEPWRPLAEICRNLVRLAEQSVSGGDRVPFPLSFDL